MSSYSALEKPRPRESLKSRQTQFSRYQLRNRSSFEPWVLAVKQASLSCAIASLQVRRQRLTNSAAPDIPPNIHPQTLGYVTKFRPAQRAPVDWKRPTTSRWQFAAIKELDPRLASPAFTTALPCLSSAKHFDRRTDRLANDHHRTTANETRLQTPRGKFLIGFTLYF